jgi:hypothetical protein
MTEPFKDYLQSLQKDLLGGDSTEYTHRPALKTLLESLAEGIRASNEPKQLTECGKPDMTVSKGLVRLGHIETKDIGKNLDEEEKSDQLKRYLKGFPNLLLTDYLEFRWYIKGERRYQKTRFKLGVRQGDRIIKGKKEDLAAVRELLGQFLTYQVPTIGTAKELARRLAGLARIMQAAAFKTLEQEAPNGTLKGWLAEFEENLIKNLTPGDFADMYTQTLAYGLFAAKVTLGAAKELTRETAAGLIPETNPFLKKLFYHLAGPEVPDTVDWVIDDLIALLNKTDWEAVLKDFGKGSLERDPVVHFYETFLAHYAPEKRERRGVYYTPEPVVSYIVRAIDYLLKESFGRPLGLADPETLVLDPACGTGTFLHSAIALIYDTLTARGQAGAWNDYVTKHLVPRVFGFELLMAPYAVAHLKLPLLLKEKGYTFAPGQRLGVYLTNTLEEGFKPSRERVLARYITEETNTAARIKQEDPIEVILGNPPYSGHSANRGEWIRRLVGDYKQVDGLPLKEKNPKWLQDDYVKFWRWGQWRIGQTGRGVLAMITNHGYLDNPTFRGMRQQLMQHFSEIYLLNLHGNAKKKEVCPDGSRDENVFDIQQGAAIGIFVKQSGQEGPARVYYADLWGLREGKYHALAEKDLRSTPWQELQPQSPFYLFVPQDVDLRGEYDRGWPVNEIFPVNSVGIVTARDRLTIAWSAKEVMERVKDFASLDPEEAREKFDLGEDVRDWKVILAQKDLQSSGLKKGLVAPVLYRPFDVRYTYYTGKSRGFICMPRPEVMRHMIAGDNLAICYHRREEIVGIYSHFLISRYITEHGLLSSKTTNFQAPLYLYPAGSKRNPGIINHNCLLLLCEPEVAYGRKANISTEFLKEFENNLNLNFVQEGRGDLQGTFGPEDVFYYAYAVFHAPTYRRRYAEFLKLDFPRLPLTSDKALFSALVARGAELAALHLMESPALDQPLVRFDVSGSNRVEKVRYAPPAPGGPGVPPGPGSTGETPGPPSFLEKGRVYINQQQYFEGVPPEVWNFHIGGYQVLHKWLKDRKGRTFNWDDITQYQKIVVALKETIRLMAEIDAAIPGWPIQ